MEALQQALQLDKQCHGDDKDKSSTTLSVFLCYYGVSCIASGSPTNVLRKGKVLGNPTSDKQACILLCQCEGVCPVRYDEGNLQFCLFLFISLFHNNTINLGALD